jgi:hypothetical protein
MNNSFSHQRESNLEDLNSLFNENLLAETVETKTLSGKETGSTQISESHCPHVQN